jgi:serine/threonine protein kinase
MNSTDGVPEPGATARGASLDVAHGRRVGEFELLEQIGSGATSRVYRGRDCRSGEFVAIKVIHIESIAPDFQRRLRNEPEIQQGVGHENIVRLIDWFELGEEFFLVMECVDGRSLHSIIHSSGAPMPFERARGYLLQILSGIEHLHSLGIVHRDIKPANILIADDGSAKLADFGIAKFDWQPGGTATRLGLGTPEYMSPEQASGGTIDRRSDLYSLGITFYEMLTGRSPFARNDLSPKGFMQVVSDLLNLPLPDPRQYVPGISAGTVAFLERATAKNPDERFQSAEEFRAALLEIGSGATMAIPARESKRRWKIAALALALLAVGGIAWGIATSNNSAREDPPRLSAIDARIVAGDLATRYESGWRRKSVDSITALYLPESVRYLGNDSATPAMIRAETAREIAAIGSLDSFTLDREDPAVISLAELRTNWRVVRKYRPQPRMIVRDTSRYQLALERRDGVWGIASQQLLGRSADTIMTPPPSRPVMRSTTPAARPKTVSPAHATPARKPIIQRVPEELRKILRKIKHNDRPKPGKRKKG